MEHPPYFPIDTSIEVGDFLIFWMDFVIFSHVFPCFPMFSHSEYPCLGGFRHGARWFMGLLRSASKPTFQPQDRHVFVWTWAALEANLMFDHHFRQSNRGSSLFLATFIYIYWFWCGYGSVYSVILWCGHHNFVGSYGVPWYWPTTNYHSRLLLTTSFVTDPLIITWVNVSVQFSSWVVWSLQHHQGFTVSAWDQRASAALLHLEWANQT